MKKKKMIPITLYSVVKIQILLMAVYNNLAQQVKRRGLSHDDDTDKP